jgi:serine/threonine protein kinase
MTDHQDMLGRVDHPEFRARRLLDQGGMGSILEAAETRSGRPVALKVMHPEMMDSADARRRFHLEARVLARLEHPNIVPLHVLKTDRQGRPFYTMKKVEGRTLQAILSGLRKGDPEMIDAFPLRTLVRIFNRVCDALAFAHANGVVHRDLKPANIMVGEFGEVLVMDWGLAKVLGDAEEAMDTDGDGVESVVAERGSDPGSGTITAGPGAFTEQGAVMGTPQYMSPEQARGLINDIDQRSDVFALGGLLYAILTLHPPFHGNDVREILTKVCRGEITDADVFADPAAVTRLFPTTRADFTLSHCPSGRPPEGLFAVAMKAMSVPAEERYQTVGNLQVDIEAWLDGRPTSVEAPSLLRFVTHTVRRHRVPFVALTLVLASAVVFAVRVGGRRARAEAAFLELRAAVPMFEEEARALTASRRFEDALNRYRECLALMPERAGFHVAEGNLHQSLLNFSDAVRAYEEALRLDANATGARASLDLSKILAKARTGDRSRYLAGLSDLRRLMERQGRHTEAGALGEVISGLREDVSDEVETWRSAMVRAGASRAVASRLKHVGGRLSLDLTGVKFSGLEFLKGMPMRELNLSGSGLSSLAGIEKLPLEKLTLTRCPIVDLRALGGMKLKELRLGGTKVGDVASLRGMPLRQLDLSGTAVADLSPLKGMPLEEVNLGGCSRVMDLSPVLSARLRRLYVGGVGRVDPSKLSGLRLEVLDARGAGIRDLGFLKEMPLRELVLDGNPVADLKPLGVLDLRTLSLARMGVSDLSPIQGLRLKTLNISHTRVADLGPVSQMLLEELEARSCPVSSVEPLRNQPLKRVDLTGCALVRDVTPLADCLDLEYVALPFPGSNKLNLGPLRSLPHLMNITLRFDLYGYSWSKVPPADSKGGLWAFYDAKWAPAFKRK